MKALLPLPNGETLEVLYLHSLSNLGDMLYLHVIRSGRAGEDSSIAVRYKSMEKLYAWQFGDIVAHSGIEFDAVVRIPSSRSDSEPYFRAIPCKPGTVDLTPNLSRKGKVRAASSTNESEFLTEFEYTASGNEPQIESLLIVDESFASGLSVSAALNHLRKAGLRPDAKVTVAVPALLRVVTSEKSDADIITS